MGGEGGQNRERGGDASLGEFRSRENRERGERESEREREMEGVVVRHTRIVREGERVCVCGRRKEVIVLDTQESRGSPKLPLQRKGDAGRCWKG